MRYFIEISLLTHGKIRRYNAMLVTRQFILHLLAVHRKAAYLAFALTPQGFAYGCYKRTNHCVENIMPADIHIGIVGKNTQAFEFIF